MILGIRTGRRRVGVAVVVAPWILLCACSGDDPTSPDPVLDRASLIASLQREGADVASAGPLTQPFFSVEGQVLRVNGQDVQTFEYPSDAASQADAARVSPDGSTIGTSAVTWIATPHFFLAGRVVALYVGDDAALLGLLRAAMGAQFAGG